MALLMGKKGSCWDLPGPEEKFSFWVFTTITIYIIAILESPRKKMGRKNYKKKTSLLPCILN